MRLIAVPLARAKPGAIPLSTFLAQAAKQAPNTNTTSSSADGTPAQKQAPFMTRMLDKASTFWVGLGKPGVKSTFDWKRRTYETGEKLMDRIEYEEWALKGVDPALGPKLSGGENGKNTTDAVVPLHYPSKSLSSGHLLASLNKMTQHRTPHHRQRLIWCIVGMPITAPFALVPIVPNLPFFYLVWRAYSHWKAYKSSEYLGLLLAAGKLKPTPSDELEAILSSPAPALPPSSSESKPSTTPSASDASAGVTQGEASMLLQPHHIKRIVEAFQLDEQRTVDLERARAQTFNAITSGKIEKLEREAEELAKSNAAGASEAVETKEEKR